jgi:hypothetical protein
MIHEDRARFRRVGDDLPVRDNGLTSCPHRHWFRLSAYVMVPVKDLRRIRLVRHLAPCHQGLRLVMPKPVDSFGPEPP